MSNTPEPKRRLGRPGWASALRLFVYLCVVGVGTLCWCVHAAYADIQRAVMRMGGQLAAQLGDGFQGSPESVQINGQTLFVSSTQSEHSVREVLDRFAASCGPRAAELGAQLEPSSHHKPPAQEIADDAMRLNVLRMESASEGQLACFAQPTGRSGLEGMLHGLQLLLETGDLAQLGDLRYVTARTTEQGRTHVISVWSQGELRLAALFPESGDAPGTDMPDVPRPPNATRGLCATAPGRSFALRLYDSPQRPEQLLAFYDRELPKAGWQSVPTMLPDGMLRPGVFARAFVHAGRAIAIGVEGSAQGPTSISLIDLGSVRQRESREGALKFE